MFLDEYDNREAYDKNMKTMREDPEVVKLGDEWFPKWDALLVPGSKRKGEVWTEVEKLRVELSNLWHAPSHLKSPYLNNKPKSLTK